MDDKQQKESTWEELEMQRIDACESADAVTYARLCIELQLADENIERPNLYEAGLAELEHEQEEASRLDELIEKETNILEFLRKAVTLPVQIYIAETERKRSILVRYFPESFAEDGKQPIQDYTPGKVGALFRGVYDGYVKKLKELTEEQSQD